MRGSHPALQAHKAQGHRQATRTGLVMGWRDQYRVHPAADVFPMMSDEELDALGEDIKANGLKVPIAFHIGTGNKRVLIDGRNRLEAMERFGLGPHVWEKTEGSYDDPVAHIIGLNIRRRHLTKAQQAELIVAAIKAGEKLDQAEPVSKGGRGKKSKLKEKAVAAAAAHDISESSVKRAIAKADRSSVTRATMPMSTWPWWIWRTRSATARTMRKKSAGANSQQRWTRSLTRR
jgi:hypothetical protein